MQLLRKVGEEPGIARSVSIQKSEKVGIRPLPSVLDGGAVTSILFKDD
jgi:hypothetical protein